MPAGRYPVAYKRGAGQGTLGHSKSFRDRLARTATASKNVEFNLSPARERYKSMNYSWNPEPIEGWGDEKELAHILAAMQKDYPTFTKDTKYEPNPKWALGGIYDDFDAVYNPGGYDIPIRDYGLPMELTVTAMDRFFQEWYLYEHSVFRHWPRGGGFGGGGATGSWGPAMIGDPLCVGGFKKVWKYFQQFTPPFQTFGIHGNGRFTDFYGYNIRSIFNVTAWSYVGWQAEWNFAATGESNAQPFFVENPGCETGICSLPDPATWDTNFCLTERYLDPDSVSGSDPWTFDVTTGTVWQVGSEFCTDAVARLIPPLKKPKPKTWREAVAPKGSQPSLEEQSPEEYDPFNDDWRKLTPDMRMDFEIPGRTPLFRPVAPGGPMPPVPPVKPPTVSKPPNSGRRVKVGRRTKEPPKADARSALGPIWIGINMFTEAEDFIKDLHNALPKKYQEPKWQPNGERTQARHMLDNLYKYGQDIDWPQAFENFLNSQIEDLYYGLLIGKSGKALNQASGAYTGGTRLLGNTVGKELPPPPKVDTDDPAFWWVLIA